MVWKNGQWSRIMEAWKESDWQLGEMGERGDSEWQEDGGVEKWERVSCGSTMNG